MRGKYARRRAGRPAHLARLAAEHEQRERALPRTGTELWHEAGRLGLARGLGPEATGQSPILAAIRDRTLVSYADLDLLVEGTPLEWLREFHRGRVARRLSGLDSLTLAATFAGTTVAETTAAFQAMSRSLASIKIPNYSNRRHR